MRLVLASGVAMIGLLALSAQAQPTPPAAPTPPPRVMAMHHAMFDVDVDANHDGWVSRAEAGAAADRMFDHMDSDHDGRLTPADHHEVMPPMGHHLGGPGEPMVIAPDDANCQTANEDLGHGDRRVTVTCHDDPGAAAGHRVERQVIITRNDDDTAPTPPPTPHATVDNETYVIVRHDDDAPMAPHAHPPMMMMLFANSDEMDTNHDGAISREEFREQQLRFFDASDVNRDGKIRFQPPPMPPMPEEAPEPPTPPATPAPHG